MSVEQEGGRQAPGDQQEYLVSKNKTIRNLKTNDPLAQDISPVESYSMTVIIYCILKIFLDNNPSVSRIRTSLPKQRTFSIHPSILSNNSFHQILIVVLEG